ncbi:MAG: hypothetical protein ACI93R_000169 [Flavobacteriales bacterium]|jgi:hypothetical protein
MVPIMSNDRYERISVLTSTAVGLVSTLIIVNTYRALNINVRLVWIDTPQESVSSFDSGFSTLLECAGLDERKVLSEANASYTLGRKLKSPDFETFFPYGGYGLDASKDINTEDYLHYLSKSKSKLSDLSLSSVASGQGKFAVAPKNNIGLTRALSYGANLDTTRLISILMSVIKSRDVEIVKIDSIANIERNNKDEVTVLHCDKHRKIDANGDFWCDFTGHLRGSKLELKTLDLSVNRRVKLERSLSLNPDLSGGSEGNSSYTPVDECCFSGNAWCRMSSSQTHQQIDVYLNDHEIDCREFVENNLNIDYSDYCCVEDVEWKAEYSKTIFEANVVLMGNAAVAGDGVAITESSVLQFCLIEFVDAFSLGVDRIYERSYINSKWSIYISEAISFMSLMQSRLRSVELTDKEMSWRNEFDRLGSLPRLETDAVSRSDLLSLFIDNNNCNSMRHITNIDDSLVRNFDALCAKIKNLSASMPSHDQYIKRMF